MGSGAEKKRVVLDKFFKLLLSDDIPKDQSEDNLSVITERRRKRIIAFALTLMLAALAWTLPALAAFNEATDPGGGGISLTDSGQVEVVGTGLQLVKQVWDTSNTCLASSPADAGCNGGATSTSVPAGTTLNFLIYVDNSTGLQATDVRIQDAIDESATGFTYVDGSLTWNNNATATGAAILTIYTDSAANGLLDPVDADIASSVDTGAPAGRDNITIGAVTGQANAQLNIPGSFVFGLRFQMVKQ